MTLETNNTNSQTTKPRRWFRFRLRTLLILITLLSLPLGWIGLESDQRRKEKVVVAWVEEMGGQVSFAFTLDERSWWKKRTDKWFGERVLTVGLDYTSVSDISPLAELKKLELLFLSSTAVSNLSPLADLKNLNILYLHDTPVNDLSPLAELKNLGRLDLTNTQVTEEQLQELRLALPNCELLF